MNPATDDTRLGTKDAALPARARHRGYLPAVAPALLSCALFVAALFAVLLPALRHSVEDRQREVIREMSLLAWTTLTHYQRLEFTGHLARTDAQAAAIAHLRNLRYGPEMKDYFWITDTSANLLMHPYRYDLEGCNLSDSADPKGKLMFREFAAIAATQGEGYVEYLWQWQDSPREVVPKVSYVKAFAPWGWIVGTGAYVHAIQAEIGRLTRRVTVASLGILGAIAALLALSLRQAIRADCARQTVQERLDRERATLEQIIEHNPYAIQIFDAGGHHLRANQAFIELFKSIPPPDYCLFDDPILLQAGYAGLPQRLRGGELVHFPDVWYNPHQVRPEYPDRLVFVRSHVFPILDQNGIVEYIVAMHEDSTERKRAEEASEFTQFAIDHSADAAYWMDSNGHLVYMNDAACQSLGYSRNELLSLSIFDIDSDLSRDSWPNLWERLSVQKSCSHESHHKSKSGRIFPVEIKGNYVSFGGKEFNCAFARDITERKRVEETLRTETDFRRATIERATEGLCVCHEIPEFPYVRFTIWNERMTEITGYTMEEINARGWYQTVYPDPEMQSRGVERMARMRQGDDLVAEEWEITRADGAKRVLSISTSVLRTADGLAHVLGLMQDITERKRTEEELKRRVLFDDLVAQILTRFSTYAEAEVDDGITAALREISEFTGVDHAYVWLAGPDRKTWTMTHEWCAPGVLSQRALFTDAPMDEWAWSDALLRAGQVLRINSLDDYPPEASREREANEALGVKSLISVPLRGRSNLISGAIGFDSLSRPRTWSDSDLGLLQMVSTVFANALERKHADEALRDFENRYHELLESLMEGMVLVDQDETIQYCNPAFTNLVEEASATDLIGKSFLDYLTENQRELVLAQTGVRKRGISSQYELEVITAKGAGKTILVSASPRFDLDHTYLGSLGTVMDLTERKKLEELAARAEKLEAAGRIAGQVAHDFNNLLGPLMAYPELIRDGLPEDHPVLKFLHAMEKAAEQMAEINQQLLTLGRRGHYNQEPLNLNDIVHLVMNQVIPVPEGLTIRLDLCPSLMTIKGGGSQIFRALANLFANARDAVQDAGTLTIRTENFYVVESIGRLNRVPQGEYVKLTITDTGHGIPPDILPKIFDPFFTTKPADRKRGSGLGLSIVHAVLQDHKAYIDCQSTPGRGTSFYLYFPISREPADRIPAEEARGGSERILVVDDDHMQREVTRSLLERLGYSVITADSGEQALALLKAGEVDLLILDMIMPGSMDGVQTYREVLKIRPTQRAVIVSGYAESDRVAQALRMGAGGFLKKPLTLKSLALAVRKELDRQPATCPPGTARAEATAGGRS